MIETTPASSRFTNGAIAPLLRSWGASASEIRSFLTQQIKILFDPDSHYHGIAAIDYLCPDAYSGLPVIFRLCEKDQAWHELAGMDAVVDLLAERLLQRDYSPLDLPESYPAVVRENFTSSIKELEVVERKIAGALNTIDQIMRRAHADPQNPELTATLLKDPLILRLLQDEHLACLKAQLRDLEYEQCLECLSKSLVHDWRNTRYPGPCTKILPDEKSIELAVVIKFDRHFSDLSKLVSSVSPVLAFVEQNARQIASPMTEALHLLNPQHPDRWSEGSYLLTNCLFDILHSHDSRLRRLALTAIANAPGELTREHISTLNELRRSSLSADMVTAIDDVLRFRSYHDAVSASSWIETFDCGTPREDLKLAIETLPRFGFDALSPSARNNLSTLTHVDLSVLESFAASFRALAQTLNHTYGVFDRGADDIPGICAKIVHIATIVEKDAARRELLQESNLKPNASQLHQLEMVLAVDDAELTRWQKLKRIWPSAEFQAIQLYADLRSRGVTMPPALSPCEAAWMQAIESHSTLRFLSRLQAELPTHEFEFYLQGIIRSSPRLASGWQIPERSIAAVISRWINCGLSDVELATRESPNVFSAALCWPDLIPTIDTVLEGMTAIDKVDGAIAAKTLLGNISRCSDNTPLDHIERFLNSALAAAEAAAQRERESAGRGKRISQIVSHFRVPQWKSALEHEAIIAYIEVLARDNPRHVEDFLYALDHLHSKDADYSSLEAAIEMAQRIIPKIPTGARNVFSDGVATLLEISGYIREKFTHERCRELSDIFERMLATGLVDRESMILWKSFIKPDQMKPTHGDWRRSVDDSLSFIQHYGLYSAPRLFQAYQALRSGLSPSPELARCGIHETGGAGLLRLQRFYRELREALLEDNFPALQNMLHPIAADCLACLCRFNQAQFPFYRGIEEVIEEYRADRAAGRIEPVPSWLTPGAIAVSRLDFAGDASCAIAPHALDRAKTLADDYRTVRNLGIRAAFERERVVVQKLIADRRRELLQPLTDEQIRKDSQRGGKIAQGRERALAAFDQGVKLIHDSDDLRSLLSAIPELEISNSPMRGVIRRLALALALREIPSQSRLADEDPDNITPHTLAALYELFSHRVMQEGLAVWQFPPRVVRQIEIACSAKALYEELGRLSAVTSRSSDEIRLVPSRGILGELSGSIADACWTARPHIMRDFPDLHTVIFVRGGGTHHERLCGATLLVEATKRGSQEKVLVIRGFNPIQNTLATLSGGSFLEEFISWLEPRARAAGFSAIAAPFDAAGGASSNRPEISIHLAKTYATAETIELETSGATHFNGYDITDKCRILRTL